MAMWLDAVPTSRPLFHQKSNSPNKDYANASLKIHQCYYSRMIKVGGGGGGGGGGGCHVLCDFKWNHDIIELFSIDLADVSTVMLQYIIKKHILRVPVLSYHQISLWCLYDEIY